MKSVRGPNVDPPDRHQVQETPSLKCSNWTFKPQQLVQCQENKGDTFQPVQLANQLTPLVGWYLTTL